MGIKIMTKEVAGRDVKCVVLDDNTRKALAARGRITISKAILVLTEVTDEGKEFKVEVPMSIEEPTKGGFPVLQVIEGQSAHIMFGKAYGVPMDRLVDEAGKSIYATAGQTKLTERSVKLDKPLKKGVDGAVTSSKDKDAKKQAILAALAELLA